VAEYIHFVLQRLRLRFSSMDRNFRFHSIGVSFYSEHAEASTSCCQNADIRDVLRQERRQRALWPFSDASMEREALARMKVEQSLRLPF